MGVYFVFYYRSKGVSSNFRNVYHEPFGKNKGADKTDKSNFFLRVFRKVSFGFSGHKNRDSIFSCNSSWSLPSFLMQKMYSSRLQNFCPQGSDLCLN